MWIQRPFFKIFATVLAVSLVMVGIGPASTLCKGACDCCKGALAQNHNGIQLSEENKKDQPHVSLRGLSSDNHRFLTSFKTFFHDNNYLQKIDTSLCEMVSPVSLKVIQGIGAKRTKIAHSDTIGNLNINSDFSPDNPAFTGPVTKQSLRGRAYPIPIYILNNAFLC